MRKTSFSCKIRITYSHSIQNSSAFNNKKQDRLENSNDTLSILILLFLNISNDSTSAET
jgi:hypothetical protein